MKESFWQSKWEKKEIGFHQESVNPYIEQYGPEFFKPHETVLVPLCGASIDMVWLANFGLKVIGVEFSEQAAIMFFEDQKLAYTKKTLDSFTVFEGEKISILVGDIFNFTQWKGIKFVYDRASIVALPEDLRTRYSKLLLDNLDEASIFLISFEFDNEEVGPPFSVPRSFLEKHFSHKFKIQEVESHTTENPAMHGGVLSYMKDTLFYLKPKN